MVDAIVTPPDLPALPLRAGTMPLSDLVDLYLAHYAGRDPSRVWRLRWWVGRVGAVALQDLSDDHVHAALQDLATRPARYFAGKDVDGRPVYLFKRRTISPATVNRYCQALAAVITWGIKRRIAPKGYVHPCRTVERNPENNERTRFLSDAERQRLLEACRASKWPRLYLLVLMALTTGARKGELQALRWEHVDLVQAVAFVGRTKNGDPRVLPLVPAVVDELRRFEPGTRPGDLVFRSPIAADRAFGFEPHWHQAVKAAKVHDLVFHGLRHSCASMLAQSGATLLEVAEVLGHRQLRMAQRYAHLTTGHKAALVNRVMASVR